MHWVPMTNWTYGEVRSDNAYKGGGGVNDGDFCTLDDNKSSLSVP